jgi:hypothetical protein
MEILIQLTREHANYFCDELKVWGYDAKITRETEHWADIEVDVPNNDLETCEGLITFAFNTGLSYGKKLKNNDL